MPDETTLHRVERVRISGNANQPWTIRVTCGCCDAPLAGLRKVSLEIEAGKPAVAVLTLDDAYLDVREVPATVLRALPPGYVVPKPEDG